MNNSRYIPSFHLGEWIAYAFFFLMLFVPLTYQPIRAVFLGLTLGIIIISTLMQGRLFLHRTILLWTLLIVSAGLVFVLVGIINHTPGVLYVSHVFVLWPLVFALLLVGITNERLIGNLIKVLVFTTIAISLYALIDIATMVGWLPDIFPITVDKGQRIGFHQGFIHYVTHSIYTLLFTVPFLVSALMTWPKNSIMPVSRCWLWIALVLSLVVTLLTGRRALWIVVALSPFLTIMLHRLLLRRYRFINRKTVSLTFGGLILTTLIVYFFLHFAVGLDFSALIQRVAVGFQQFDCTVCVRREQFFTLLRGWSESPLIGAGLGAVAEGPVRSIQYPWQYELFYLSLLFHVGIIGFIIYSAAVAWIYRMGFKMIRSGEHLGLYMLPILVGTSCFLIASATNPYLGTFSGIWPIYLPMALINVWLLAHKK